MERYYITDRSGCPDVLGCIARAAADGVDYIQIREKDLSGRDLLALTRQALDIVRFHRVRLLVNGRADIAMAAKAHGVHLPSDSVSPREWRRILPPTFVIAASCHTIDQIRAAEGADMIVFGPIFPSPGKGPAVGVEALHEAALSTSIPLHALGGVDESNAAMCIQAGARGIAGIRMFQQPLSD